MDANEIALRISNLLTFQVPYLCSEMVMALTTRYYDDEGNVADPDDAPNMT